MRSLLVIPLVVGACVDMDDHGQTIVGTSGDVQTQPGEYVGYRVAAPCESRGVNLGVIGTGSVELSEQADLGALVDELGAALRDMPSIWGRSGYGISCEAGVGATLYTNDWRDVDAMIARIGDYLHDHDYAVQVGISVGSIPVAQ
jgi:hypothetical protein